VSAALLLAWVAVPPVLVEIRNERVDGRPAVVVVAATTLGEVSVRREGPELVVSLAATALPSMAVPAATTPLEAIRIVRTPGGVQLRLRIAADVPLELRRELDRAVLFLGPAAPPPPPPSSADLYRGLFPPSASGTETGEDRRVGLTSGRPDAELPSERPPEERPEGLHVGGMTFKPSAALRYVDADVSLLDTPQTVRDRYAEARPALGFELPLRDGQLRLDYEARIRRYSSFEEVNHVSHQANGHFELPVGTALTLRGSGHFARGLLESAEVDPGGEYFFHLGRFTRRQFGGGVRFRTGGRFDMDVAGGVDKVTVDEEAGFFDYERRSLSAAVGIEIGPQRRASVVYSFEQVPASPERPEAESRLHSISGAVEGEIMPLLNGRVSAGYARRESPRAPEGGQRFNGLTFGAQLTRDFGRSAHLFVSANRSTELSAFERNSFYIATSVRGIFTAPLPLSFALTAGGGYHVNVYSTAASAIGAPRRDVIVDWLAGVSRSLSRWAFVRADYRHDRRDSNLDFFDQRTHAFYAEVGFGFFPESAHR
jgi:hypothetical protein